MFNMNSLQIQKSCFDPFKGVVFLTPELTFKRVVSAPLVVTLQNGRFDPFDRVVSNPQRVTMLPLEKSFNSSTGRKLLPGRAVSIHSKFRSAKK